MCWKSKEFKPLVSDGNVKIKKVCLLYNGNIHGYYYHNFIYELNKEYQTNVSLLLDTDNFYSGSVGFHSYLYKEVSLIPNRYTLDAYLGTYFITAYSKTSDVVIVEGYIPKGATYYINENKEIISDRIVLTNITHRLTELYR